MEIDVGESNKHGLRFRTGDISALTKMFQAVKDIEKIIRLGYNSDGLYMNEIGTDGNVVIFGTFPAVNFHEFKADGPGMLCFHTGSLVSALINNSQRDEVTIIFNPNLKKKKNELQIIIKRESSSDTDIEYNIPLLEGERTMYEWKNSAVIKYVVMVKSDVIQSFISTIVQTGSDVPETCVKISINENIVCFECIDGVVVSNIRLAIMTDKGRQENVSIRKKSIIEGTVSKKFYVRCMSQIIKFMNINTNDSITIYMSEDSSYPIIFQINIGSIGCMRIAIGPKLE